MLRGQTGLLESPTHYSVLPQGNSLVPARYSGVKVVASPDTEELGVLVSAGVVGTHRLSQGIRKRRKGKV